MKQISFYPGCALQSMSWDYRESIKQTTKALDVRLIELPDWTCCGATAAHSLNERISIILPARNLATAQALGNDLAAACPMCFKRLNISRTMLVEKRVEVPWSFDPGLQIVDLARFLAGADMIERIRQRVVRPLRGLRTVCYYGCQVVRPPKISGFTDYENPLHLDRLVEATGAEAVDWSYKATCCGAGVGISRKDIGFSLVSRLLMNARASGAQAIVVCCPLCQNNLDLYQAEIGRRFGWGEETEKIPVFYYTELLGVAFGLEGVFAGLKSHMVDPLRLIERIAGF